MEQNPTQPRVYTAIKGTPHTSQPGVMCGLKFISGHHDKPNMGEEDVATSCIST